MGQESVGVTAETQLVSSLCNFEAGEYLTE